MRNARQIESAAAKIAEHSPVDAELFRTLIDEGNEANRAAWDAWRSAWDVYHVYCPRPKAKAKRADGSDLI